MDKYVANDTTFYIYSQPNTAGECVKVFIVNDSETV